MRERGSPFRRSESSAHFEETVDAVGASEEGSIDGRKTDVKADEAGVTHQPVGLSEDQKSEKVLRKNSRPHEVAELSAGGLDETVGVVLDVQNRHYHARAHSDASEDAD